MSRQFCAAQYSPCLSLLALSSLVLPLPLLLGPCSQPSQYTHRTFPCGPRACRCLSWQGALAAVVPQDRRPCSRERLHVVQGVRTWDASALQELQCCCRCFPDPRAPRSRPTSRRVLTCVFVAVCIFSIRSGFPGQHFTSPLRTLQLVFASATSASPLNALQASRSVLASRTPNLLLSPHRGPPARCIGVHLIVFFLPTFKTRLHVRDCPGSPLCTVLLRTAVSTSLSATHTTKAGELELHCQQSNSGKACAAL